MFFSILFSPFVLVLLPVLYYLLPYIRSKAQLGIPGPLTASFSNLWLMYHCRRGKRYLAVDEAHKKYGPLVRLQPNHVSVADPDAIPIIYGHGNGFLKSDYYDAFVCIQPGVFNTRDRSAHARKRKIISHAFSAKSIGQFEQYMHHNLEELVKQWDRISDAAAKAGRALAEIDSLHWFNYMAFDIIGDLAFGAPFGMISKGADIAEVRMTPSSPVTYAPAVQVLNRRGEVSATLGCLPSIKPYAKYLPDRFFRDGVEAVEKLAGIAVARVNERLEPRIGVKNDRVDIIARLMEGKDEKGDRLGRQELTAEVLTQLIAGSDTTSNTSCAMLYWVLRAPEVLGKLQKEVDAALPDGHIVPEYEMVKDLPYLGQVISETLRIHSTSSIGLPRVIPPGPIITLPNSNRSFPPGTVLSVPVYTIHHSTEIWGADASSFNPDRWAPERITDKQKRSFIPFSHGPRACVGRNVAEMELALILATVVRGWDWVLREKGELETREGFLRKPVRCRVGFKKRER